MTISTDPNQVNSTEAILYYLRQSPNDSLKKSAADLIEQLQATAPLTIKHSSLVEEYWKGYGDGHNKLLGSPSAPLAAVGYNTDALAEFTEYFVKNYPGPNTIISNPNWHAPKIFAAAKRSLTGQVAQATVEPLTDEQIVAIRDSIGQEFVSVGMVSIKGTLAFARALLAAAPPTSKATAPASLVGELETFLTEHEITGWREDMFAGLRKIMFSYDQTFDVATSKADTGEAIRNAALEEAAHHWGIAHGFDKHGVSQFIRKLKSATPSTIKEEPITFPYQQTFDAIAEAITWHENKTFKISIRTFQDAFNSYHDKAEPTEQEFHNKYVTSAPSLIDDHYNNTGKVR